MQRLGFIHDMLDVKLLILFVTSHSRYPMTMQQIYELCYQDECLSYFDVCTAIPEMVETGHLKESVMGCYVITDKGREQGAITEDSIAYPVRIRAQKAIEEFNQSAKRQKTVTTEVLHRENGEQSVRMTFENDTGIMMELCLAVPPGQADHIEGRMKKKGTALYQLVMEALLSEENS